MTDEQMDTRLREAGARWREATPVPMLLTERGDDVELTPEPHHPRRARTWIAAVSGAVLVAAAVVIGIAVTRGDHGSPRPAGQAELAGTSWQLADALLSDGRRPPGIANLNPNQDAGRVLLAFAATGTRIVVGDGCNTGSGPVQIRASRLVLGDLARTAMGCPSTPTPSDAIDRVFVGEVSWTITGGRLILTKSGVGSLTYVPLPVVRPSTDPAKLVGVTWGLTGVEHDTANSGSGSSSSDTTAITLTFDRKGAFAVHGPCLSIIGRAALSSGKAVFSDRTVRPLLCPQISTSVALVQPDLEQVLAGTTAWSITDGTLTITKGTATGNTKLTFTDHPNSAPSSEANPPATSLLGTRWLLADVNSPTFHQTLDTTKTKLTLTIDAKGVFGIDDGVNFHSPENQQPIGISAESIFLGQLTTTAAGCVPVGAGAQNCTRSNVVAEFFAGTIGWAVHGDHLTLTKGRTTLVYVRA